MHRYQLSSDCHGHPGGNGALLECGKVVVVGMFLLLAVCVSLGQEENANYDEAKVPAYTLPDPLVMANGQRVANAGMWTERRRPELLRLFEKNVYGRSPGRPSGMAFEVNSMDDHALGGTAVRKEVTVYFSNKKDGPKMQILMYLPKAAHNPVPMFLGLNFSGNQAVARDPGITMSRAWMPDWPGVVGHRATETTRGINASGWQVEKLLSRGYGLATIYYGDIEPDFVGGIRDGVRPLFFRAGQSEPAADEWGAVGAWAWGLRRALDYLETCKDVDARRVALIGHSRLGKAALWAGAQDQRAALVVAVQSGEGGAKLNRRDFGETVKAINTRFPHWFCGNFKKFNDNVSALPVDQHELIALVAPRPVYISAAAGDLWSDPKGMFLAAKAAEPVYRLFGTDGLGASEMPGIGQPVMTTIGYHLRAGGHEVTEYDWEQFQNFADKYMKAD
jgi:hypothetical protein